jgi:hypothetical protein
MRFSCVKALQKSFLLIAGALISSCATPTEYKADTSHPIRSLTVSQNVPVPKKMTFVGLSEMLSGGLGAALGGAAGAGIVAGSMYSREGVAAFDVGQSVRNEFIAAVQKSGKFTVKNGGPADAEVQLNVTGYGFQEAAMFGRRVRPILSIEAKMVRSDGRVVWKHRRAITHLTDETPAVLPEQMKQNPKLGAEALRAAARVVATRAVESLHQ